VIRDIHPCISRKPARSLAKEEHISINQLLATALAEKIAVLDAETYIKERAKQ